MNCVPGSTLMTFYHSYYIFPRQYFDYFAAVHYKQDVVHTFHCLHKDLLFLSRVLLVQQHAMKDAAKCACLKTHTHKHTYTAFYLRNREGEESQRHCIQRSKCHGWLICGQRWTAFCLNVLCLLMGLDSFGCCLADVSQNKSDSLELRRPFIT